MKNQQAPWQISIQSKPDFVVPFKLAGAPFPPSPSFVQRADVMYSMERTLLPTLEDRQRVLVLQGLGGIGKS